MTYQKTAAPWLFLAGGAAVGLVALTAAKAGRRRARGSGRVENDGLQGRLSGDVSDVPAPVREALAASARSRGLRYPISEELTQDIFRHATEQRAVPGNRRHELSSLVGPGAIAPDPDAIGEELVDPGIIEVPLGQSAEREIDRELSHAKLLQPDSTGASLQREDSSTGLHEQFSPLLDERDLRGEEQELTALPHERRLTGDDAYDAVAPDDLGSEWLARATEAGVARGEDELPIEMAEILESGSMSVVSQGSLDATSGEQLEAEAIADLDGDLDELVDLDERQR